jgi:hypothetical protein
MALDGRRRLLGHLWLVEQGLLTLDHEIDLLICDTKEQQARATVLLNTEHPAAPPRRQDPRDRQSHQEAHERRRDRQGARLRRDRRQEVQGPGRRPSPLPGRLPRRPHHPGRPQAAGPPARRQRPEGMGRGRVRRRAIFSTTGLRATVQGARVDINDAALHPGADRRLHRRRRPPRAGPLQPAWPTACSIRRSLESGLARARQPR